MPALRNDDGAATIQAPQSEKAEPSHHEDKTKIAVVAWRRGAQRVKRLPGAERREKAWVRQKLDVSNSTGVGRGGVGADGHRTATARFHLLQAELLASTAAGGRVFTGAGGDTCLPAGKLRAIRSFSVAGVPADAVPFVNMEGPGDSAALLNARMCRREIRWLVDPTRLRLCQAGRDLGAGPPALRRRLQRLASVWHRGEWSWALELLFLDR